MNRKILSSLTLLFLVAVFPQPAHALLPPDLIFNVGSQVVQLFSISALFLGGLISAFLLVGSQWLSLAAKHIWQGIGLTFLIIAIAMTMVYFSENKKQQEQYSQQLLQVQSVNDSLKAKLSQSIDLVEYEKLLALLNGDEYLVGQGTFSSTSMSVKNKNFMSDTITLYSEYFTEPFILEIDVNQMETSPGFFTQYTFLNGAYDGDEFSNYEAVYSTSTNIKPNSFMPIFSRQRAADLLTRDNYSVSLLVKGEPLTFSVSGVEGDFVTRYYPEYTQHQSVVTTMVTYKGVNFPANVLIESAYSNDHSKYIFSADRDRIEAKTYQFILWDEENNFYMVDSSDVTSDTPEYPSHSWSLYKNYKTRILQKSFKAEVKSFTGSEEKEEWQIDIGDFNLTHIKLSSSLVFKEDGSRKRMLVSGTISDSAGTRAISGTLHEMQ